MPELLRLADVEMVWIIRMIGMYREILLQAEADITSGVWQGENTLLSTPCCRCTIIHDEMPVRRKRLEQVRHCIIRRRRERQVDIREQRVPSLPSQFLPQKLNHSLKPVRGSDLVKVLLHDLGIAHSLETHDHFGRILLLITFQGLDGLHERLAVFTWCPRKRCLATEVFWTA